LLQVKFSAHLESIAMSKRKPIKMFKKRQISTWKKEQLNHAKTLFHPMVMWIRCKKEMILGFEDFHSPDLWENVKQKYIKNIASELKQSKNKQREEEQKIKEEKEEREKHAIRIRKRSSKQRKASQEKRNEFTQMKQQQWVSITSPFAVVSVYLLQPPIRLQPAENSHI